MRGINLANYLENSAAAHPGKTALIFEGRKYTFEEVDGHARAVANGLKALGIEKGDRITLLVSNTPEFIFFYFGILKIGAIVNPLNVMLKMREIDYVLNDCTPKLMVASSELSSDAYQLFCRSGCCLRNMIVIGDSVQYERAIEYAEWIKEYDRNFDTVEVARDDIAAILYTSGTTGKPKGVMLSHHNLWTNGRHSADWAETTYWDTGVSALPMFHSMPLTHVMAELWMNGGTFVLLRRFDPKACLEALVEYKATAFWGVATMYHAILNMPDIDAYAQKCKLRYCVTGAAVTPEPILKAWNQKFTPLSEGYGLTEAAPVVCMNPMPARGVQKANSCGFGLVPEIEVDILDIDGNKVKTGEVGELVVRGPNVMLGYWNRPQESAETLRGGWLHTGDLACFDEDGYIFIKDRKKDIIITGGFNIYPKEIEDLLYTHPAVGEAQVVGLPDLAKGEIAVACIALKKGQSATEEEIINFCRENMAIYKSPRRVLFLDELPKTATNKLEKMSLRKKVAETFGQAL